MKYKKTLRHDAGITACMSENSTGHKAEVMRSGLQMLNACIIITVLIGG